VRGSPAWQAWEAWSSRVEIVEACAGLRAWPSGDCECLCIPGLAGLKGSSGGDHVGLRGGSLGSMALVGLRSRAGGSKISQRVEQQLCGPMGQGLACSTGYFFSIWWCGETSHELRVQNADVSGLPCALPQSCVSPASHQSLWIMELRRSAAVSQSLSSEVYD
jgi:hypothetical protein